MSRKTEAVKTSCFNDSIKKLNSLLTCDGIPCYHMTGYLGYMLVEVSKGAVESFVGECWSSDIMSQLYFTIAATKQETIWRSFQHCYYLSHYLMK